MTWQSLSKEAHSENYGYIRHLGLLRLLNSNNDISHMFVIIGNSGSHHLSGSKEAHCFIKFDTFNINYYR